MNTETVTRQDAFLQPLGRSLVIMMYAACQSLRFYPIENATVESSLIQLHAVAKRLLERETRIELRLAGQLLFINDARLRLDLSDYAGFSFMIKALQKHGIGQVDISSGVPMQELATFLSLLLQDGAGEEPFERFAERLRQSGGQFVTVLAAHEIESPLDEAEEDRAKQAAKQTYFQSVHVVKEVLTDTRLGRAVNVRRVKRAVQSIVDQVLNNEHSMLGMTVLRDYDEYTFTHSVNVCIISVIIGQKLGLDKSQLYELGVSALFHDIGKQRIDPAVVNKAAGLDDYEWAQMQRHPTEGLLAMFAMRGLAELPYRAMLQCYEHHMKIDLTGYPRNIRARRPTLFSLIVQTADGFDAATSRRSYQHQPWTPDEVLREMRDNPRRGYHPLLVKALVNVIGVFPVGTLAILDSLELAVVTERNPDPLLVHQPLVKIISEASGARIAQPVTVDLGELDAAGKPRRTIIKTVDPEKYGIRVADYFA